MDARNLIAAAILDSRRVVSLGLPEWDLLVRQARAARLLGRLYVAIRDAGGLDAVPPAPRAHLESGWNVARAQAAGLGREVFYVARALRPLDVPVLLLKGAAYAMAGLPNARGRTVTDIDILVPRPRLREVELALMENGWLPTDHDAYDQRYYRQWMHELPPMRHIERGTLIDVHHNLLPETARDKPDAQRLFDRALPLAGHEGVFLPCATDLVLHAASHLFHEGETDGALRDLFDLDAMLRHFGASDPGFWGGLADRAEVLGLARFLHYTLRYCGRELGTPVPAAVRAAACRAAPSPPAAWILDKLYRRAFRPQHASAADAATSAARGLLYLRGHWLRMPLPLLVLHLARKALRRDETKTPEPAGAGGR